MPASSGSSNSSRKLLNLLLLMLVIIVMFGAVVALWVLSSDPAAGGQNNTSLSYPDSAVSINISGVNRISLLRSLEVLNASGETGAWFRAHPEWRLFQAQADYVDGAGLSKRWNVIVRSADSSLIAYVDNGNPILLQVEDVGGGDGYPASGQDLRDSYVILGNATGLKGLVLDTSVTPFALAFSDDGGDGTYRLSYSDPASPDQSFAMAYNARSGEIVEA